MQHAQLTGCHVNLVGYLKLATQTKNVKKYEIVIERDKKSDSEKSEFFLVEITLSDFIRIKKFGYMGMLLSISGDLRESDKNIEIIAEKIDFLPMSKPAKFKSLAESAEKYIFDEKNIQKLKKAVGYQSSLYFEAIRNVH